MRQIKPSTEAEMVCQFLKMEIDSDRFTYAIESILKEMQLNRDIITNGNIDSDEENALRATVLQKFRGYRDSELFERFPQNIKWMWTTFGEGDISKILYMEYSYWNDLSNYTGSPLEAAKKISAGERAFDIWNDDFIKGAEWLKEGNKFPPLIFLTDKNETRYIVLEGHARMTAYGLAPDFFKDVQVLLGYCDSDELNKWYGEIVRP